MLENAIFNKFWVFYMFVPEFFFVPQSCVFRFASLSIILGILRIIEPFLTLSVQILWFLRRNKHHKLKWEVFYNIHFLKLLKKIRKIFENYVYKKLFFGKTHTEDTRIYDANFSVLMICEYYFFEIIRTFEAHK